MMKHAGPIPRFVMDSVQMITVAGLRNHCTRQAVTMATPFFLPIADEPSPTALIFDLPRPSHVAKRQRNLLSKLQGKDGELQDRRRLAAVGADWCKEKRRRMTPLSSL
jgi:hypothetical protein